MKRKKTGPVTTGQEDTGNFTNRIITAIEFQAHDSQRVNIYLDGQFAFGLHVDLAVPLQVNQYLDPEQEAALRQADEVAKGYTAALDLLARRPRSRGEIQQWLKQHKVPPPTQEQILERLEENGLLDDKEFARFWVENRNQFRPRSVRALRYELQQKGVTVEDQADILSEVDEVEGAYQAAWRRAQSLAGAERRVFDQKLGAYLQRRGYNYDVVRDTLQRLWLEVNIQDNKPLDD
ncbi:MAG: RecX family transcriptional regulator, partial [Chloroflexi bacterium]|nr:RecX family transcriptional regulator [Chloroflexota bacterium]